MKSEKKVRSESENSNKKARSPEKLNEYIRIGSPGGILLIIGLVILAAALIVWGFVGRIPVTIQVQGSVAGKETESTIGICFIDTEELTDMIPVGSNVVVRMMDGRSYEAEVESMIDHPMSAEEIREYYNVLTDWVMDNLLKDGEYFYVMGFRTHEDISDNWHRLVNVTVVIAEEQPISYLTGK